jgi:hypothetical protein
MKKSLTLNFLTLKPVNYFLGLKALPAIYSRKALVILTMVGLIMASKETNW